MKPFRFPLESLRAVRQHKELTTGERYAGTLRACEAAAASLQNASNELTVCWTGLCEHLAAGVQSLELLRARAWCNVLELRVKERALALEKARRAVDAVWEELMRATRQREELDRLRQRRYNDYRRNWQREEQKMLDELGLLVIQSPVSLSGSARTKSA
jgi:flagellar FliJ protein